MQGRAERGDALFGAAANLRNSPPAQYSEQKCSCQSDADVEGCGTVVAFSVSLGQRLCCTGDTPKRYRSIGAETEAKNNLYWLTYLITKT